MLPFNMDGVALFCFSPNAFIFWPSNASTCFLICMTLSFGIGGVDSFNFTTLFGCLSSYSCSYCLISVYSLSMNECAQSILCKLLSFLLKINGAKVLLLCFNFSISSFFWSQKARKILKIFIFGFQFIFHVKWLLKKVTYKFSAPSTPINIICGYTYWFL